MSKSARLWSGRFLWGLVVCTAVLAVAGIAATFLHPPEPWPARLTAVCVVALAGVAGFALGVANSAAAAMKALAEDAHCKGAFTLALCVAVLTGLVSLVGVHVSWSVLTGRPEQLPPWWAVDLAGLGLAFVKPAMSYVVTAVDEKAERDERAAEAAEQARRDAIAAAQRRDLHEEQMARIAHQGVQQIQAPAARPDEDPPEAGKVVRLEAPRRPAPLRRAATIATATLATSVAAAQPAAAAPAQPFAQHDAAAQQADPVTAARALIASGVASRNQLTKRVPGLSKHRAAILLDELSPGWRERNVATA